MSGINSNLSCAEKIKWYNLEIRKLDNQICQLVNEREALIDRPAETRTSSNSYFFDGDTTQQPVDILAVNGIYTRKDWLAWSLVHHPDKSPGDAALYTAVSARISELKETGFELK